MAQSDLLRKYLDAGMAFTQMTQQRAEGIVKNLVELGEVQREQAQAAAEDLLDRSRKNTEKMVETVRAEVRSALAQRSLATKADIDRLEARIGRIEKASTKTSGTSTKSSASSAKPAKAKSKKRPAKASASKKRAAKKKPAAKRSS